MELNKIMYVLKCFVKSFVNLKGDARSSGFLPSSHTREAVSTEFDNTVTVEKDHPLKNCSVKCPCEVNKAIKLAQ